MTTDTFDLDAYKLGIQIVQGQNPHDGMCAYCNRQQPDIANRRLNAMYTDDDSNWMESCYDCYSETVDYYAELWDEYYRSQGV